MISAHKIYRRAGFVDFAGDTEFLNFEGDEVAMQRDFG
jgi:hypothetical protein